MVQSDYYYFCYHTGWREYRIAWTLALVNICICCQSDLITLSHDAVVCTKRLYVAAGCEVSHNERAFENDWRYPFFGFKFASNPSRSIWCRLPWETSFQCYNYGSDTARNSTAFLNQSKLRGGGGYQKHEPPRFSNRVSTNPKWMLSDMTSDAMGVCSLSCIKRNDYFNFA